MDYCVLCSIYPDYVIYELNEYSYYLAIRIVCLMRLSGHSIYLKLGTLQIFFSAIRFFAYNEPRLIFNKGVK